MQTSKQNKKTDLDDLLEKIDEAILYCDNNTTKNFSIFLCTAMRQAQDKIELNTNLMRLLDKCDNFFTVRHADKHVRTIERLKKALMCNSARAINEEPPKFIVGEKLEKKTGEKFPSEETIFPESNSQDISAGSEK